MKNPGKWTRSVFFAGLLALPVTQLFSVSAQAALQGYISIKGQKQGQFKGDAPATPALKNDWLPISGVSYEVLTPRDPASGLPTGKRLHKPVIVTKEWGTGSPQIYQALITNENLPVVEIDFYQVTADGKTQLAYSMKMTNAAIGDVRQATVDPAQPCLSGRSCHFQEQEQVSFTFQRMEITNHISKTTVVDDWNSEQAQ